MEPENNVENNVPEESKIEVEEVTTVEERPTVETALSQNEKMSKTSIIGMVILTIIALAGVAFGIWGIKEKDDIEKSLATGTTSEQTVDCITEKDLDEDEDVIDIDDTAMRFVEDYIYVSEWGIKIEIPDGLSTVSYKFAHGAGFTKLVLWGADCSEEQCQYFPDFADADKNVSGLGVVLRYPAGTELSPASQPELIFSDGEYDYRYAHVQAAYSTDQSEIEHEVETVNLITEMLSDPDNYSEI